MNMSYSLEGIGDEYELPGAKKACQVCPHGTRAVVGRPPAQQNTCASSARMVTCTPWRCSKLDLISQKSSTWRYGHQS